MVPLGSLKGLRVDCKQSSVGDSFFFVFRLLRSWDTRFSEDENLLNLASPGFFVGGLRGSDANFFVFPDHQVKKLMKCMIG